MFRTAHGSLARPNFCGSIPDSISMRILITVNTSWNVVNFRMPIVEALLSAGHEVVVLSPADRSSLAIEKAGARHIHFSMDRAGMNPLKETTGFLRFIGLLKKINPDVVLSYTIKNNILALYSGRLLGIPVIPNISGLGTAFLSGSVLALLAKGLYRVGFSKSPAVFFQNPDDLELFQSSGLVRSEQARLIPGSGVDLDYFKSTPLPKGPPTFLMISRVLQDKGVREFAAAARAIRLSHERSRFVLLGAIDTGNPKAIDQEDVVSWEREGILKHLDHVEDVRPYIAAAHCVVLPSYREGAPRSLMESAAMARPLIATSVPGCRHVVENGVTGILCAPRSAQDLERALRQFLSLPRGKHIEMGRAGRCKMEVEFDQKFVVEAYLDVVSRVAICR